MRQSLRRLLGNSVKPPAANASVTAARFRAAELKNRGNEFLAADDLDQARACYEESIAADPDYAEAYNNLGIVLSRLELSADARSCLEQAIRIDPQLANAQYNMATVLRHQGRAAEAITHFVRAIELNPEFEAAYVELSHLHFTRKDHTSSRDVVAQGLSHLPSSASLYNCLGNLCEAGSELEDAVTSYRRGLSHNPDSAEMHNNLGLALQAQGKLEEAAACHRHALGINPDFADAYSNLGIALQTQGKLDDAMNCFRHALELKPDSAMAHSNLIFAMDLAVGLDTASQQAERRRWDERHAAHLRQPWIYPNAPDPERRLRVGYVSADFRRHSAAVVFGAMLTQFDSGQFEVFAYSNTKAEDANTQIFREKVTHWRDIVDVADDGVADMIRNDGIDILVDLSGHSAGNRLLVFARKPAPIQVTAWGYASSTGMRAMDVFFADAVSVPPEEKALFTEDVRYLPCVVGYSVSREPPAVAGLPALTAGAVTFGSLNRIVKISDDTFNLWMQILSAIPSSRMVVKAFDLDDQATRDRVAQYFSAAGIALERVTLLGKTSWDEHVAVFNRIDIALDPFPHGGGVTALEGLMMGVPMITLRCPTIAGRLSASILTALGLTDWIASTEAEYVELARRKAADLAGLERQRGELRGRFLASVLGDEQSYVKVAEAEYRQLWREWCERRGAEAKADVAEPA